MTTNTDTPIDAEPSAEERRALFDELSDKRDATVTAAVIEEPLVERQEDPPEVAAPSASTNNPDPAGKPAATPPPVAEKTLDDMTPEELKAHALKLENDRRAAIGRAAALQRDQDRARRASAPAPATAVLPDADRLDAAFPDLSAAVKDEVERRVTAVQEATQKQIVETNLATLEAIHPGWFQTMRSDDFSYWLTQQAPDVQAKFDSNSVADYAGLLSTYKAGSTTPPTATPPGPTEAERLAAQRSQRVQQQQTLPRGTGTNGNQTAGEAGDPETLFNQLAAREDLKRERARLPVR